MDVSVTGFELRTVSNEGRPDRALLFTQHTKSSYIVRLSRNSEAINNGIFATDIERPLIECIITRTWREQKWLISALTSMLLVGFWRDHTVRLPWKSLALLMVHVEGIKGGGGWKRDLNTAVYVCHLSWKLHFAHLKKRHHELNFHARRQKCSCHISGWGGELFCAEFNLKKNNSYHKCVLYLPIPYRADIFQYGRISWES